MKSNSSLKKMTKRNILLWSLSIMMPLIVGFIFISSLLVAILPILESESFNIVISVCMGLGTAAVTALAAGIAVYLQRLPGLLRLNTEENFLNIRINETLGKIAIPGTDSIFLSDQWFVMTMRGYKGYVFHINYIVGMENFHCSHNHYENGYRGRLLTADKKALKVFFGTYEYETFIKWFLHFAPQSRVQKGALPLFDTPTRNSDAPPLNWERTDVSCYQPSGTYCLLCRTGRP